MPSSIDAHVRLDTHPTHPSAVTAVLTGAQAHIAQLGLEAANWTVVADNTLVLVRIDHEESYWAQDAAQYLRAEGVAVEITTQLREAMNEEWTWANYPMPWCTRSEIREISNQAQKIHDDIRHGHLLIHAHAHDGHTTVAVGTYLHRNGKSVYLHGEDHLRQIADTFDSPAQAMLAFEKIHGAQMRPGPAPLTDTERAAAEARTPLAHPAAKPDPARPKAETVPAYLADAGDHNALLDAFIYSHSEWDKWNTWDDRTTIATHESLTLRILFDHEAGPRDARWSIAAYETPVSERMWHMTVTPTTPAPVLGALLRALAAGDAWETALGTPVTDKHVTQATHPLTDAGWAPAVDGRWLRWRTQSDDVGVQFDAFAAQNPNAPLDTWTLWAGPSADRPTWTVRASAYTPASLLADLSEELAHGTGARSSTARATAPAQQNAAVLPPKPPQQNPAAPRR